MQLPDIKLDSIPDEATRALVEQLLNLVETLAADTAVLRLEVQQLRDENTRLTCGSGKPDIKPPLSPPPTSSDYSSEAERHTRTPRGKPAKNPILTVTREQHCQRASLLLGCGIPTPQPRKETITPAAAAQ